MLNVQSSGLDTVSRRLRPGPLKAVNDLNKLDVEGWNFQKLCLHLCPNRDMNVESKTFLNYVFAAMPANQHLKRCWNFPWGTCFASRQLSWNAAVSLGFVFAGQHSTVSNDGNHARLGRKQGNDANYYVSLPTLETHVVGQHRFHKFVTIWGLWFIGGDWQIEGGSLLKSVSTSVSNCIKRAAANRPRRRRASAQNCSGSLARRLPSSLVTLRLDTSVCVETWPEWERQAS